MNGPLFVTGASGFVGRATLRRLAGAGRSDVRLLVRTPASLATWGALPASWRVIRGDLDTPAEWCEHLAGVETVLHMAASTGKVRRGVHFEAIVGGTRRLLHEAQHAGVARFLYISSVAAAYAHRRYYHYAEAKLAAEQLVRESSLDWLIVRPTMVFGQASPVLEGLRKLALLPVPIVFGAGTTPVEPIAVDDLGAILVAALHIDPWDGRTITAGGPERVTIEELLRRMRASPATRAVIHIPLAPMRELLGMIEPLLLSVQPLTAGQLATFANPSVSDMGDLASRLPRPTTRIAGMLGHPSP